MQPSSPAFPPASKPGPSPGLVLPTPVLLCPPKGCWTGGTAGSARYEPVQGMSSGPLQSCFPSLPLPVWDFSCQHSHQFPVDWPFSAGVCLGMSPASLDRCRVARSCGLSLVSRSGSQFCTGLWYRCLCSHSQEHGIRDKRHPASKRELGFYPRSHHLTWERTLRAPIPL